jgi:hypothetical protein
MVAVIILVVIAISSVRWWPVVRGQWSVNAGLGKTIWLERANAEANQAKEGN